MKKQNKPNEKAIEMPKPTREQKIMAFKKLFVSKVSIIPLVIALVAIYFIFVRDYPIGALLLIIDFFVIYLDYRENIRQMILKQMGID